MTRKPSKYDIVKDYISHHRVKFIFLTLFLLVVMLLPTILAVSNVFKVNHTVTITESLSVTIYDHDHNHIASETEIPERASTKSLVGMFNRILESPQLLETLPSNPSEEKAIYLHTEKHGVTADYSCFFSFMTGASFYIDSAGKGYRIPDSVAENFLVTPYAASLYASSALPRFLTNAEEEILSTSSLWNYKRYDGIFEEIQRGGTENEDNVITYEIAGALEFRFETAPDYCLVRAFENGSPIFEGSYEELSSLTTTPGSTIRLDIHARWNRKAETDFYGSIHYNFDVRLRDRSVFSLNENTLFRDGFLILSCTNIRDPAKIIFSSDYKDTPSFFANGTGALALLTCPSDLNDNVYRFTVSYGAASQKFAVNIEESPTAPAGMIPAFTSDISNLDDIIEHFPLLIQNATPAHERIYFRGNTLSPSDFGLEESYAYHAEIAIENSEVQFRSPGKDYRCTAGKSSIYTLMSGEVLHTGSTPILGNYVVVYHGAGLCTWYCHLSTIDVSTGDLLAVGDLVGKCGIGGIASGDGVLILCTIGTEAINPDFVIGQKFEF